MTQARRAGLGAIFVFVAYAVAASAAVSTSSRIGPTGVGAITFGITPKQAAAAGLRFEATAPSSGSSCFYLHPKTVPGLAFMVEHNTIRRAEVTSSELATTDGFRVGDEASKIQAFYSSRSRVLPDKYDPKTQIITVTSKNGDPKYRMSFLVKGGSVRAIYAGVAPQIDYVEGCS